LVVFSFHRAPVEAAGSRPGWACISGAVSASNRTEILAGFQAGAYRGIALTIGAGSEGIDLTYARHSLMVDQDWRYGANEQARKRLHRFGQTRKVLINQLIADHPIDQIVRRLVNRKGAIGAASVEASAVGVRTTNSGTTALEM
ncbi:hypothetical protein LCGC14_3042210, partial [marine sediment metagenome]